MNPIVTDIKQEHPNYTVIANPNTLKSPEVQNKGDCIKASEEDAVYKYLITAARMLSVSAGQSVGTDSFDAGVLSYEEFLAKQNKAIQTASDIRTKIESLNMPTEWQEAVDYKIKSIDTYIDYLQLTIQYAQAKSTNSSSDVIYHIQVMEIDKLSESNDFAFQEIAAEPSLDINLNLPYCP